MRAMVVSDEAEDVAIVALSPMARRLSFLRAFGGPLYGWVGTVEKPATASGASWS